MRMKLQTNLVTSMRVLRETRPLVYGPWIAPSTCDLEIEYIYCPPQLSASLSLCRILAFGCYIAVQSKRETNLDGSTEMEISRD